MDRDRRSGLHRGLIALVHAGASLVLAGGFVVTEDVLTAPSVRADVTCEPPSVPVPGPNGEIRCQGRDPGGPGGPDPDPGPGREPREGEIRTAHMYEECTPNNPNPSPGNPGCNADLGTCAEPSVPTNHYTREEVYHRATGWRPTGSTGSAAGDYWVWQETICREPNDPPTAAEVWEAVRRFSFPGAKAQIQPVDGRTLVHFPTNFFTNAQNFETTLQVGGAEVQIWATPTEYVWDFGDNSPKRTTKTPGAAYPDMLVTHEYEKTGTFRPSVTVMYHIDWAYAGNRQSFDELLPAATSPETPLEVVQVQGTLSGN
ncbi:MAG TPA: PKD domain-containing protein [Actinopolymorphaceae bacterium]